MPPAMTYWRIFVGVRIAEFGRNMARQIENWRVGPIGPLGVERHDLPVERLFHFARSVGGKVRHVARPIGPVSIVAQLVHEDRMPAAREEQQRIRGIDRIAPGAVGTLQLKHLAGQFGIPFMFAEEVESAGQPDALDAVEAIPPLALLVMSTEWFPCSSQSRPFFNAGEKGSRPTAVPNFGASSQSWQTNSEAIPAQVIVRRGSFAW